MNGLAIDPGQHAGWARFENGRVLDCGLIHLQNDVRYDTVLPPCHNAEVVIETPVYRQGGRNRVDPNDLIRLGMTVGRILEVYVARGNRVFLVPPASWKGSVRKDIQARRTSSELSLEEGKVVTQALCNVPSSYLHNVWDAVGIALWFLRKERAR